MISLTSEEQLKDAFRPIDRHEVRLPDEFTFPLIIKDYISWNEPGGVRIYLLFQDPNGNGARGVVFKRSNATREPVAQMCQWCHSVRSGNSVSLLTAKLTPKRAGAIHTIGLHLCSDLSCKDKVLGTPDVNDLREPFSGYQKLFRVLMNMAEFCRNSLNMRLDRTAPPKSEDSDLH